ncbi:MAG: hypothetical protein IKB73_05005 [Ruminococcus sp.]|nr:hypothetical protein [Ruminococcus sp.]
MKKVIAILVAILMIAMCSITAFAEISPTAKPSTDTSTGTGKSPQTGDSAVVCGSLALLMAAAASCFAVKKIKE